MAKTNLKPLAGYVLIEPIDDQETTASGLVMPEKAKEKPGKGKVIAVGDPIEHYERESGPNTSQHCPVKVGDIVIYHKWAGNEIKDGSKNVVLVKFADLQGVYE